MILRVQMIYKIQKNHDHRQLCDLAPQISLKFARTLNSSIENGESRINTAIYNATKNAISSMSQDEVITSRDGELADMVMGICGCQYGAVWN